MPPPIDLCVAALGAMQIGRFRCRPDDPKFTNSGPIRGWLLVFPRTSVWIRHAGGRPVLADPSRVMLYNRGQEYTRAKVAGDGDRCEWLSFAPETIREAISPFDPSVDNRFERPFTTTHAPVDAVTYALQRRAFERAARQDARDTLAVEEAMLDVLARVVTSMHTAAPTPRRARDEVDAVKRVVLARLGEPLSLAQIARAVGMRSAYQVARAFRAQEGRGVHAYRIQLRLRAALERVAAGEDLTTIALDMGFSSHSHFTTTFTRVFGQSPRAFRATLTPRKNLEARARLDRAR